MKIGIITITDGQNYGNRLQNYAVQTVLRKMGHNAETIRRKTYRDKVLWKRRLKNALKNILRNKTTENARFTRRKRFDEFNAKYLSFSKECLYDNKMSATIDGNYDFFVFGGDQIWNTHLQIIADDIANYLGQFAAPQKRVSFSASFGTSDIMPEYAELFKENLTKFKAIGVRENAGKELVHQICQRDDAVVVLDPTMMLDVEDWKEIAKKPSYVDEDDRYCLTYFLGGRNEKVSHYIDRISEESNSKAINLDIEFLSDDKIANKDFFTTSPEEFVWLIEHAECVLTDSYHACVFSVLFGKPFVVFDRKSTEAGNNMGSRIESLLNLVGLPASFRDDVNNPTKSPESFDYEAVMKNVSLEKEKSYEFLSRALSGSEL